MSPVLWANFGPLSRLLAAAAPPRRPPIVILSLPRSGSSWVGSALGRSDQALYLREPISQRYLTRHKRRGVVFRLDPNDPPAGYEASAVDAFSGLPSFSANVVRYPGQWRLSDRRRRHVLIKEVNPFAIGWLTRNYNPSVIYLIRHPAGVAASFSRLGWLGEEREVEEERRFSFARVGLTDPIPAPSDRSAWGDHAALQAEIMKSTLAALRAYPQHVVVRYEDLCADPHQGFRRLYDFAGLRWDEEAAASIEAQTSLEEHNRFESYSLYRNSKAMRDAWRSDIPAEARDEMKLAFMARKLPYYGADEW